ncbi:MAG TPA: HrpJ domain-containing protein [Arsenophonus sp.]
MLRQFFPDDSDLVLVLRELLHRRYFSASLASEIETEINSLCSGTSHRAKTTRAGINIALKAKQFSYQMELRAMELRQLYMLDIAGQPILRLHRQQRLLLIAVDTRLMPQHPTF